MSRKRKGPNSRALTLLLAIGAMGMVAIGAYVRLTPANRVPIALHRTDYEMPSGNRATKTGASHSKKGMQSVMVAVIDGDKVSLRAAKAHGEPMAYVANHVLSSLKIDNAHVSGVTVVGGLARVEITGDIPMNIGSDEEGTLLKAMQMSLGQFSEVEQVQFVSGGQPIESLGGHVEVTDPIEVIRSAKSTDSKPSEASNPSSED